MRVVMTSQICCHFETEFARFCGHFCDGDEILEDGLEDKTKQQHAILSRNQEKSPVNNFVFF